MTSPGVAVMEVGSKVLPLAPTATVCVAARAREAVRRAIVVKTSILQGRGMGGREGSGREERRTAAIAPRYAFYTPTIGPKILPNCDCATCIIGRSSSHARGTRTRTGHGTDSYYLGSHIILLTVYMCVWLLRSSNNGGRFDQDGT